MKGISDPKRAFNLAEDFVKESLLRSDPPMYNKYNTGNGVEHDNMLERNKKEKITTKKKKERKFTGDFKFFWDKYPRKIGKGSAKSKWGVKVRSKETVDAVMLGLDRAIINWKSEQIESQFIPHPTTWLNQERWKDNLDDKWVVETSKDETSEDVFERRRKEESRAFLDRDSTNIASAKEIGEILQDWKMKK